ncbi:MAG: potassium channel protein [Bacteroidales bacterium]|nr:potassium channel protein [Bacteroidales bacterium]
MSNTSNKSKIYFAFILIFLIIIIGVTGYRLIEGFSFIDSVYMTVITVATVGFREIKELSDPGKIFTVLLIITSLGTFAYAVSVITSHLIEGQFKFFIRGQRKKSEKKRMKNHVIICGYGRNGKQAIIELIAHNNSCVIIDNDHDVVINNSDKNLRFIEGDSTDDDVLISADIKTARALITTLPSDAGNLYVVVTARSLNPDLIIISRASSESSEKKLKAAGVTNVVMPEKVGGAHMAKLIASRDLVEFLEHLSIQGEDPTNLEEIVCANLPEKNKNKTIYEIGIRKKSGANIIGFKKPEGEYIINPTPDTMVILGSKLFVLGTPEQIESMKQILRAEE